MICERKLFTGLFNEPELICWHTANDIKVKLATIVEGDPKALFSIAYYTNVLGRALLLSLDCSTLPLIRTL